MRWAVHAAGKRGKGKHGYVENPEFRSFRRPMHMACNSKMGLREIYCSEVELIYITQE